MTTNNGSPFVRVYANDAESNIPGFKYSYNYIGAGGKESKTYLNIVDVSFFDGNNKVKRNYAKGEDRVSGLVLARLAIQIFENDLDKLSEEQRHQIKTDGSKYTIGIWTDKNSMLERWGNEANSHKQPKVDYVASMYLGRGYPSNSNGKYFFYNLPSRVT